ncbi:hypothetical protein ABID26_007420 [Mesorhizobium shonense]|uniref:Uncharacterized protein n=1 Tax=Mesorhizobium shonense TaxID=1209948 RepID=A0ABV2I680_9HYPH
MAVGDRLQFTDTLKGVGIYNGNAGVITKIDRNLGRIGVTLEAAAGREGRRSSGTHRSLTASGTAMPARSIRSHLSHAHASLPGDLELCRVTRQRESAKAFVATETARDLRQPARQIGRNEIKSASVAYATADELTPEQKTKLGTGAPS